MIRGPPFNQKKKNTKQNRLQCSNGVVSVFLFPVPARRTTFSVDPDTHIDSIEQAEQMTIEGTSKWSCKIAITGIASCILSGRRAFLIHAELSNAFIYL